MAFVRASLLVWMAACSYTPPGNGEQPTDGPTTDAPPDTTPVAPRCFGTFRKVCLDPPTEPFSLGGASNTVMTEIPSNCAALTAESTVTACVIAGTSITIDGKLTAIGGLPLVLLATEGELVVQDLVDVSSLRAAERRGAGANPTGACNGAEIATGAAGGPGGSFGGKGGDGGGGFDSDSPAAAPSIDFPGQLRGGCRGGLGGSPGNAVAGGSGGGAVWLISTVGITIDGRVNASGAGGAGGDGDLFIDRGGAGGGSGGMIVLDAPAIQVTDDGTLLAAGGGGGGGNIGVITGGDGENPNPNDPGNPANGGNGNFTIGGNGGTSGNGGNGETNGLESGCGGGGGVGFIRAFGNVSSSGSVFPSFD